jgi:hypothetical protein
VLAVACDHRVVAAGDSYRADALLRRVPARAWQCVSAGHGAKGHRLDDWAFIRLDPGGPAPGGETGQHWLLVRRNRTTGELAFYRCWMPARCSWPPSSGSLAAADHRGALPDRQGPGRPGSASGPPLALLVSLDHPGHGCPRRPRGARGHRPHPAPTTDRADQLDLQRGPAPVRGAAHPSRRRPRPSAGLVRVATPTSSPRPHLPLPTTSQPT